MPESTPETVIDIERLPKEIVPIGSVRTGFSPRLSDRNDEHAQMLSQTPGELPPIVVHRGSMRVIDGVHRLYAAKLRGAREVEARIFEGGERDAFVLAVRANIAHGMPLTLTERTTAAARIVETHPQWSDRAIAAETGLSAPTVAGLRKRATVNTSQLNARVGRDGRVRPGNAADRRRRAAELFAEEPGATLRHVAQTAGISPATARDVRERLRRGEDPVPQRRRGAARQREAGPEVNGVANGVAKTEAVVRRLMKDPSIRMSGSGRSLISWLNRHAISRSEYAEIIERVPPHCSGMVAELARERAQEWHSIAHRLEQFANSGAYAESADR